MGIAINTGRIITPESQPQPDTTSTEFIPSRKLYRTAVNYLNRLENSQHELAELIGGTMSHEATRAYVFNGINVSYQGTEPHH